MNWPEYLEEPAELHCRVLSEVLNSTESVEAEPKILLLRSLERRVMIHMCTVVVELIWYLPRSVGDHWPSLSRVTSSTLILTTRPSWLVMRNNFLWLRNNFECDNFDKCKVTDPGDRGAAAINTGIFIDIILKIDQNHQQDKNRISCKILNSTLYLHSIVIKRSLIVRNAREDLYIYLQRWKMFLSNIEVLKNWTFLINNKSVTNLHCFIK